MKRTGKETPDLLSGLDSSAAALNNARVVRDAQRAEPETVTSDADWRKVVRPRLAFAGALMILWSLGIVARLVNLQVFQYQALVARAESQQSQTIDLNPQRGRILDRFGRERNLNLPPLSDDGVGSIQRGSAVVTIHVLADKNILLLLSRIAKQPTLDETRAKKLSVRFLPHRFRRLMSMNPRGANSRRSVAVPPSSESRRRRPTSRPPP